ncbi:hypothetical protein N7478_006921 [Penicillium angulare]|uniref:uncharacterized protein n=1 Tax=Penicillium angulare TaxID=116970 RepID=UPI00254057FD|nr:uncharacterized protein N7478_006921 [Penicillium angulare]KAJ5281549.1 hypothetical protein N7478_006921 [Penicillium angulare]
MEFHNTGSFPKRRSYPNLRHISLAPLTPRFPIDDDIDQADYFNYHADEPNSAAGNRTPTRSSYLSSISVPSTPPILSHSRSTSRARHHTRSKSSTRAVPASDTNLLNQHVSFPLHHAGPKKRSNAATTTHSAKSDAEWMLRAGIALASSTREEKGQSWLSKRESSTNLVSEIPSEDNNAPHHRHHQRTKSGASSRKSRSGASTPAWSRANSRRGSRVGLSMTTIPPVSSSAAGRIHSPSATGVVTPEVRGRSSGSGTGLVPDFVDEKIRAEMESLQERDREGLAVGGEGAWDEEESESEYDYFSDETQEEFDEADLQLLTRERGFGLGGWIDRLVEWTLFGVDELPVVPLSTGNRIGATATTTTVTFEEPVSREDQGDERHDSLSLHSEGDRYSLSDDADSLSYTDGESVVGLEKPGGKGGWEDASWLFRVVKRALV